MLYGAFAFAPRLRETNFYPELADVLLTTDALTPFELPETKVPLIDDHAWLMDDDLAAIVRGHIGGPSARKSASK